MESFAESEFGKILQSLDRSGVLEHLILVGSWSLPVYKFLYDSPEIPVLRTTDLDFLVKNPKKISVKTDVPKILEQLGFSCQFDISSQLIKFERQDLEIEFLAARFRGAEGIIQIPALSLKAQVLSYMEIAEKFARTFLYRGIQIKVPEMEAFALHKALVFPLRSNPLKREKDVRTIAGLLSFILSKKEMSDRIVEIFLPFPFKWQRAIVKNSEDALPDLNLLLKDFLDKA